jgi:hypothetical protein
MSVRKSGPRRRKAKVRRVRERKRSQIHQTQRESRKLSENGEPNISTIKQGSPLLVAQVNRMKDLRKSSRSSLINKFISRSQITLREG